MAKMIKPDDITLNEFAKCCAVIMGVDETNFDKIAKIESFAKIYETLFDKNLSSFEAIKQSQEEIIQYSKELNSYEFNAYINEAFDTLVANGVIKNTQDLKELFSTITETVNKDIPKIEIEYSKSFDFNESVDALFKVIDELDKTLEQPYLLQRVAKTKEALNNKSFSIGITGVMNAGKSTLLNALLKDELLGTAVVPETANLSVIRYSKTPSARVNFWSKKQWEDIVKSSQSIPSMQEFVKNTNEIFKDNLDEFIKEESLSKEIDLSNLSHYTSAIISKGKCNLVKSVEIDVDLPFLEDGVVIVDTPGLDDPVVQREEITKKYLSECDLMIHLMNVSQSATQKDVEFIIDALTYQGISRLLVVLTRIDAISKEELKEVEEYTKRSIKSKLISQNKGALFNLILSKLEFIAISGKLALMHRTGRVDEALKLGYTEEQTGILKLEEYLNETLFGPSSPKATLLLNSNAKMLYTCTSEALKLYGDERGNLSKSSKELKEILALKEEQNQQQNEEIASIFEKIENYKDELSLYGNELLLGLNSSTNTLKNKLHSLIYGDVKYELNKNGKKPADERVSYFIQSGLKDGVLDVIRDYRFKFNKKSLAIQERVERLLDESNLEKKESSFDVKSFFSYHQNSINTNHTALINDVLNALKKSKKSTLDEFSITLDTLLSSTIKSLENELVEVLKTLNTTLLEEFSRTNEEPLNLKRQIMQDEVENLKRQIILTQEDAIKTKARVDELGLKINALDSLNSILEDVLT